MVRILNSLRVDEPIVRVVSRDPVKPNKTNVSSMIKFALSYQTKSIVMKNNKRELAKWTKQELIELGPTFIKIGQFVSTRSDLFDKEVIKELTTLQDNTPSFSIETVKKIISEDFGRPWDEVFEYISPNPLASASISQVHKAKLKDIGEEVVIKIQRPFIQEYFDRDFATLKFILDLACNVSRQRSLTDTKVLLDDCYEYLYEELSFYNEIENIKLFREIFKDKIEIIVPRVYEDYSDARVITMEYIESDKISKTRANLDKSYAAVMLMESFLKQILDHGVIHADPHPGNIGITKDGRVVLYDYGQVVKLDRVFIENVKPMLFAIYERDIETVITLLIKSKTIVLKENINKKSFVFVIERVLKYFENTDISEFQMSVVNQGLELDLPFKINPKLIMVFRSLSLLEGICKELDSEFNYFKVIDRIMGDVFLDMDYLDHRARKDIGSFLETLTTSNGTTFTGSLSNNNATPPSSPTASMDGGRDGLSNTFPWKSSPTLQKGLVIMLMCGIWDFQDVPKSLMMASAIATFYATISPSK